ncbi:MAG: DUF4274 domain-containing protein [Ruminococcus sp.]|nr:DUF4274 domain-containing protein [Ruminococcus sp.]
MTEYDTELFYELLYEKSESELVNYIEQTEDSVLLHIIAVNYNWDNGFDIPRSIIDNKYCDVGTALMIFSDADGYGIFFDDEKENCFSEEWFNFVTYLKYRIDSNSFICGNIRFVPQLSRADIFHLKKRCTYINKIFIKGSEGMNINVPLI